MCNAHIPTVSIKSAVCGAKRYRLSCCKQVLTIAIDTDCVLMEPLRNAALFRSVAARPAALVILC